ncbi:IS21 family transposase [Eggerthella sinensis]|uniref:IS21 family transposase n=2 Tax=Eggerthella sinensis TaxID=242230 RepID=A0A3N0J0J3_9ACTN|nr:IS21 family transposase [Eggerthella sinensis]RNM42769.1 IS21 family transposase [Eggerthella sinensis]
MKSLFRKGKSIAAIAREIGMSEPTVRKYARMEDFSPVMRVKEKRSSKLDKYEPLIRQWMEEDRRVYRKQRHTITRIRDRFNEECDADVGYTTVRNFVNAIRAEEAPKPSGQYLHLVWYPGEAQIDFGEADCLIKGKLVRMHYLVAVFPFSNVGFTQLFHGETAECVCQGLKDVFEYMKGIPKRCIFDNATGVGRRICDETHLTDLFGRFCVHYGFDADFCNPYSGNEKGCVENRVAAFRNNLLVPAPDFDDITS